VSATTAGAVKAYLEAATPSLGLAWFRDKAPEDQALPFGVIQEALDLTMRQHGDLGDPDADLAADEMVQVTVFQEFRNAAGKPGEVYGLADKVARRLHGARLPAAPTVVYAVTVRSRVRLPRVDAPGRSDSDNRANIVQDVVTVTVHRRL
jgi:hypothetical protein